MDSFWTNLTEPQATIIGSAITVVGAAISVLVGWGLFSGTVTALKDALEASKQLIIGHKDHVESVLSQIAERVDNLDSRTQEGFGKVESSLGDIQLSTGIEETPDQEEDRETLRSEWSAIRDNIESIAASTAIDGRTRARYSRIDRRKYTDLINALANDGHLGQKEDTYRQALNLWSRRRNARHPLSEKDIEQMSGYRQIIVGRDDFFKP